jgi:hypothetical protein
MLGRTAALVAIVLGVISSLASEAVLYDLLRGLGALLFLPFTVIPLEALFEAVLAVSLVLPPSLSFLVFFLVGTLLLGLVEFG